MYTFAQPKTIELALKATKESASAKPPSALKTDTGHRISFKKDEWAQIQEHIYEKINKVKLDVETGNKASLMCRVYETQQKWRHSKCK